MAAVRHCTHHFSLGQAPALSGSVMEVTARGAAAPNVGVGRALGAEPRGDLQQSASISCLVTPSSCVLVGKAGGYLHWPTFERGLPRRGLFCLQTRAVQTAEKDKEGSTKRADGKGEGGARRSNKSVWVRPGFVDQDMSKSPVTVNRRPSRLAERRGGNSLDPQQQVALTALLGSVRAWPVDVDLNQMLGTGGMAIAHIDEEVLLNLFRVLPWYKSGIARPQPSSQAEEMESEEEEGAGNGQPSATKFWAVDDARRMLNIYDWWQQLHPERFSPSLALQLLVCLGKAKLTDEVERLAGALRPRLAEFAASPTDVATLINLYYRIGDYEDAVRVYNEAREKNVRVGGRGSVTALLSMAELDYPPEKMLDVFRAEADKVVFRKRSLETLLKAGIEVGQLESAEETSQPVLTSRLITALCELGRRDDARALAAKLLRPEAPLLTLAILIGVLGSLESEGLLEEAQQLADRHAAGGVDMGKALNYKMARVPTHDAAVQAYRSLMRLEGTHHNNFYVHVTAIDRFSNLRDADGVWQAYQAARNAQAAKKQIYLGIYVNAIKTLANAGREFEAEQVLADCYREHRANLQPKGISDLQMVYKSLVAMYLNQKTPSKVVDLMRLIVLARHWVSPQAVAYWADALRAQGASEEAAQLEAEAAPMDEWRPKTNDKWVKKEAAAEKEATTAQENG